MYKITPSLCITLFRLLTSPIVVPFFLLYAPPYIGVFVFLLMSFTDYVDGKIARRCKQVSLIGSLLDPLADKFLLYATLVTLLYMHQIPLFVVLILIGREFLILGLRHIAAEYNFSLKVSGWGKLKTFLLTLYVSLCILHVPYLMVMQCILMWATILVSVGSALQYCAESLKIVSPIKK